MKTLIVNGTIFTPDERIEGHSIVVENGQIAGIEANNQAIRCDNKIDALGYSIIPGLIDIHMHGAVGFDTMDASAQAIQSMARFLVSHGVTSFLPTTITASNRDILAAIDNVAHTPPAINAAQHLGIHLEGPYLSAEFRGAQPLKYIRAAHADEYNKWFEDQSVRLITVAPEVDGVPDLIRFGVSKGVEFAIGHSAASYECTLDAVDLGLRQATHTFNGMPALHHRTPGVLGAILSSENISAQVIVDGIHVHPAVVKTLIKAKGIDHTILISDSMRATGMVDGSYNLGDQMVNVKNGVARTETGGLAGSTLTLDQALRNVMSFTGLSLQEVLPMATSVPAKAIGVNDCKGTIATNFDADLVVMDESNIVQMVMVNGMVVYNNL